MTGSSVYQLEVEQLLPTWAHAAPSNNWGFEGSHTTAGGEGARSFPERESLRALQACVEGHRLELMRGLHSLEALSAECGVARSKIRL